MSTAGFVLLIACVNVANLTLACLSQREHEFNLRISLAASRSCLFRQLLTECLMPGFIAAGLGFFLAVISHELLMTFMARLTPLAREIQIDISVLLFAIATTVLTSGTIAAAREFSTNDRLEPLGWRQ